MDREKSIFSNRQVHVNDLIYFPRPNSIIEKVLLKIRRRRNIRTPNDLFIFFLVWKYNRHPEETVD